MGDYQIHQDLQNHLSEMQITNEICETGKKRKTFAGFPFWEICGMCDKGMRSTHCSGAREQRFLVTFLTRRLRVHPFRRPAASGFTARHITTVHPTSPQHIPDHPTSPQCIPHHPSTSLIIPDHHSSSHITTAHP